jgi:uncharacterized YccA/Bax inhibitor family protein
MAGTVFDDWAVSDRKATAMTVTGTAGKALILLTIVCVCAAISWTQMGQGAIKPVWMFGTAIAGLVLGLVTSFKPAWAPITAPLYSAAQGFFLGMLSNFLNTRYPGIAIQAVAATLATSFAMLFLYSTRIIRVTNTFTKFVVGATGALMLVYLASFAMSLFGMPMRFLHDSGPISLAVSAFAIGLAALNLLLDFDFIEDQSNAGAPKSLEWYGAFGLMVTLIWLYIEMLRLLAKLQDRR